MVSFEIKSNRAVTEFVDNALKEVEEILEEQIAITTEDIADEARSAVVTEFSILKNSITGQASGLYGSIKATANYAPYVEFGTGGDVDVPKGLESYAREFKGKDIRTVNLPARPFLYPAFKNNVDKMNERLKRALNDIKL